MTALGIAAASSWVAAQQPGRIYEVGVVFNRLPISALGSPPTGETPKALVAGLRERGWVEGKNLRLHWRTAEERLEEIPRLIDELVRRPVDVLVVLGNPGAREAMRRTQAIPIVATLPSLDSMLDSRLIESLARPGRNLTGVSTASIDVDAKQLSLLKEAVPSIKRVAVIGAGSTPRPRLAATASALGVELSMIPVDAPRQYERALREALRLGAHGALFVSTAFLYGEDARAELAKGIHAVRLPAIYANLGVAESVGLMGYGVDERKMIARLPVMVDRILRGARPAEMPVEAVGELELVVNLRAAREVGVVLPQSLIVQADRVIR